MNIDKMLQVKNKKKLFSTQFNHNSKYLNLSNLKILWITTNSDVRMCTVLTSTNECISVKLIQLFNISSVIPK